jgi:hypothetical protein
MISVWYEGEIDRDPVCTQHKAYCWDKCAEMNSGEDEEEAQKPCFVLDLNPGSL